tara:strand:- start:640 stop:1650 length:1011 start_codon:yes stop_codon:yes gene_type:complete
MKSDEFFKFDTEKMYKTYDIWPDIARDAFKQDLKKIDSFEIDHIVFAGMGGSGSIGDIISAILSEKDTHVSIVKGYVLPKTVDSKSIVIVTSASGNTKETLEILKSAKETDAKIVGFSSGGKLETYCKENDIFFQKIPVIHSPRASFTRFLYSILNVLEPILPINEEEIFESIESLDDTKKKIFSENLTEDNISLDLAKFTNEVIAIYYPLGLHSVAIRYKNCLQENTKLHAMTENIIETCHNGIVSWEKESNVKPILIQGKDDHEKTIERWRIMEEFFKNKNIDYRKINSVNGNILSKIVNLIYILDYSTIYAALLNETNPTFVNSIEFVKSQLK